MALSNLFSRSSNAYASAGGRRRWPFILGSMLVLLIVGVPLVLTYIFNWVIITPGYTGIKINRLVDQGISKANVVTGFVFYNPVQTQLVVYPTFMQRVAWTKDGNEEGTRGNEELTFNTKDSVPVSVDVATSYILAADAVPQFYTQFRADRIQTFTHGYMRDAARNVIVGIGSEYRFDDVNGDKKEEFTTRVEQELGRRMAPLGITIKQFGFIGALRPPQSLLASVNAKTQAIQDAIRAENEIRQAEAEAKKKIAAAEGEAKARIAVAEGEARANQIVASSLDQRILEWERLKLTHQSIARWNGNMPAVLGGGAGSNLLFNVPTLAPDGAAKGK